MQSTVILLKDQEVLVLGLGASGLAMARWCARQGARVTVADTREHPPNLAALNALVPTAVFLFGPLNERLIAARDFAHVFVSPGLAPSSYAMLLIANNSNNSSAKGELSLFDSALTVLKSAHGYAPQVIAVTGTNGKTTVTSLTGQLIERAGKSVAVAGNIGPSLLDTLSERMDNNTLPDVWVIELSSFQLHPVDGFEPTVATVLNITQDHLDWHGRLQAYTAAKAKVFGATGLMVLNRDDAAVMAMLPSTPSPTSGKERKNKERPQARDYVTFGAGMPTRPGDFGIEDVNGMAWLVRAQEADGARRKRNEAPEDLYIQRLMPADALRIRGRHNAVNALTALALAAAAGCVLAPLLYGLRDYQGEPHRVESVGTVNEVEFFDDSKGTNVGATIAALNGLGAERKLVVILGGEGKGQDFTALAAPVGRYARTVVLIGRDAPQLRTALASAGVPMLDAASMAQAVDLANRAARAGDAVLMSPACASFDMFENYGHRAAVFCDAVKALARSAGLVMEGRS